MLYWYCLHYEDGMPGEIVTNAPVDRLQRIIGFAIHEGRRMDFGKMPFTPMGKKNEG